jgi:hypothetical protein
MGQEYYGYVSSNDTPNDTPRKLGPYEFIAVPPIQLVLNAIVDLCEVGGSVKPGVRALAEASGTCRGMITDYLRQLEHDGWIAYDGRWITLLRDPNAPEAPEVCDESHDPIDQPDGHVEKSDRSAGRTLAESDRSAGRTTLRAAVERAHMRHSADQPSVRPADRSVPSFAHPPQTPPMVIHDLAAADSVAAHESSTTGGSGGGVVIDQPDGHWPPAGQVMAELGAHPRIIADALSARPDLTPQQVRDRWSYDQERIAASGGRLTEGVFFEALRAGQLAPPPRSAAVDWSAYATDDEAEAESLHAHARRITPECASGRDWQFVLARLASGDTDAEALAALAARGWR